MRLFLGIVLLVICTYVGYIKSNKYYFRKVFYDDFVRFNSKLKQEVAFKQGTIKNLLDNEKNQTDFIIGLKNIFSNIQNDDKKIYYLDEDELKEYKTYISNIGTGDKSLMIEYLQSVDESMINKQKQCVLEEKKYKALYVKLGFFVGLIMLILVL